MCKVYCASRHYLIMITATNMGVNENVSVSITNCFVFFVLNLLLAIITILRWSGRCNTAHKLGVNFVWRDMNMCIHLCALCGDWWVTNGDQRRRYNVHSCDKWTRILQFLLKSQNKKKKNQQPTTANHFYFNLRNWVMTVTADDDNDLVTINIKVFEMTNIDESILNWWLSTWTCTYRHIFDMIQSLSVCFAINRLFCAAERTAHTHRMSEWEQFFVVFFFVLFAHFTQRHGHCAAASIFSVWLLSSTAAAAATTTTDWAMHSCPQKKKKNKNKTPTQTPMYDCSFGQHLHPLPCIAHIVTSLFRSACIFWPSGYTIKMASNSTEKLEFHTIYYCAKELQIASFLG